MKRPLSRIEWDRGALRLSLCWTERAISAAESSSSEAAFRGERQDGKLSRHAREGLTIISRDGFLHANDGLGEDELLASHGGVGARERRAAVGEEMQRKRARPRGQHWSGTGQGRVWESGRRRG